MSNLLTGTSFVLLFVMTACGNSRDGDLVRGQIVHDRAKPFTYSGEFQFTPNSHALVTLKRARGTQAVAETLVTQRINSVQSFPVTYALPVEIVDSRDTYFVTVSVFQGAGDTHQVGDLINENLEVVNTESTKNIVVTGLEECGTPGSGGFCL